MTPDVHSRFLQYLELFGYFGRGNDQRLELATFAKLDVELIELERAKAAGNIESTELSRLVELRRKLHRD